MNKRLFEILKKQASQSFIESYVESADPVHLAGEALGILLSQHFEYDGEEVGKFLITALYAGLEDANWHTEAGFAWGWMRQLEEGARLRDLSAFQDEEE